MTVETSTGYQLLETLASWQGTAVYHARDLRDYRGVVLRLLDPGGYPVSRLGELVEAAHRAADLAHPVIDMAIPDAADGRLRLRSDLWPGESLESRLRTAPMALSEALDVARELAAGLNALHRAGLVHGAVHPANVWLTREGGVRLLGLGLAQLLDHRSFTELEPATVAFLPPEALRDGGPPSGPPTPAGDAWALGALVFEMVYGRRAFVGDDPRELADAVRHRVPRMDRTVPRALGLFLQRTLARDPDQRYSDGGKIRRALAAVDAGPPHHEPTEPMDPSGASSAGTGPRFSGPRSKGGGEGYPSGTRPPLDVGQELGGFEVIESLGRGGMGILYRARDRRLERDVALKLLPVQFKSEDRRRRFVHEAQAASALDHPHICTIYGIDETSDGDTYIAMAYYGGPSLEERLRDGPLPLEEALEVAEQIASGLAAAHGRGIVHRDIKPGNIMFSEGGSPKIVDFGLAEVVAEPGSGIVVSGEVFGTIGYIAPEQLLDEPIDQRVDIWALGVVLYEMVAGRRPFESKDLGSLTEVLDREPPPLTEVNSDLPKELDGILRRALAKNPSRRFSTASEMAEELRSLRLGDAPPPSRRDHARWLLGSVVVLLLVAGLGAVAASKMGLGGHGGVDAVSFAGFRAAGPPGQGAPGTGGPGEPGPRASSVEALGEILALELENLGGLELQRTDGDLAVALLDRLDPDVGWQQDLLGPLGDGDFGDLWAAAGTWGPVESGSEGAFEATLLLQGTNSGRRRVVRVRGSPDALPETAAGLARQVVSALGVPIPPPPSRLDAGLGSAEAGALYARALERLDVFDARGALELLARAATFGPEDPRLRLARSEALWVLGREGEALAEIESALGDGSALPQRLRIFLRARQLDYLRQYGRSAVLYRALWSGRDRWGEEDGLPVDAGRHVAAALVRAGHPEEGLAVLVEGRVGDLHAELQRGEAFHWLERYEAQLEAAQRVVSMARERSLPWALARGKLQESRALWRLGRYAEGLDAAETAAEAFEQLENIKGLADSTMVTGILRYESGDQIRAKTHYDRAARLYGSLGLRRAEARTLTNKALVLQQQGDLDAHIDVTARALELFRETEDQLAELITLVNLADPLVQRGRFSEAREALERSMELARSTDRFDAWVSYNYGRFLVTSGELSAAGERIEHGRRSTLDTGDQVGWATATHYLAKLLHLQGDLDRALVLFGDAMPVLEERGTPPVAADAGIDYAAALLDAGRA
ncbi:MAG: protein kinase, partial [Acidobacteriota bacterium]